MLTTREHHLSTTPSVYSFFGSSGAVASTVDHHYENLSQDTLALHPSCSFLQSRAVVYHQHQHHHHHHQQQSHSALSPPIEPQCTSPSNSSSSSWCCSSSTDSSPTTEHRHFPQHQHQSGFDEATTATTIKSVAEHIMTDSIDCGDGDCGNASHYYHHHHQQQQQQQPQQQPHCQDEGHEGSSWTMAEMTTSDTVDSGSSTTNSWLSSDRVWALSSRRDSSVQLRVESRNGFVCFVGTDPTSADLLLPATALGHNTIDARQAVLVFANGAFHLKDLNSSYGTYINERRVPSRCFVQLNEHDQVRFGFGADVYRLEQIKQSSAAISTTTTAIHNTVCTPTTTTANSDESGTKCCLVSTTAEPPSTSSAKCPSGPMNKLFRLKTGMSRDKKTKTSKEDVCSPRKNSHPTTNCKLASPSTSSLVSSGSSHSSSSSTTSPSSVFKSAMRLMKNRFKKSGSKDKSMVCSGNDDITFIRYDSHSDVTTHCTTGAGAQSASAPESPSEPHSVTAMFRSNTYLDSYSEHELFAATVVGGGVGGGGVGGGGGGGGAYVRRPLAALPLTEVEHDYDEVTRDENELLVLTGAPDQRSSEHSVDYDTASTADSVVCDSEDNGDEEGEEEEERDVFDCLPPPDELEEDDNEDQCLYGHVDAFEEFETSCTPSRKSSSHLSELSAPPTFASQVTNRVSSVVLPHLNSEDRLNNNSSLDTQSILMVKCPTEQCEFNVHLDPTEDRLAVSTTNPHHTSNAVLNDDCSSTEEDCSAEWSHVARLEAIVESTDTSHSIEPPMSHSVTAFDPSPLTVNVVNGGSTSVQCVHQCPSPTPFVPITSAVVGLTCDLQSALRRSAVNRCSSSSSLSSSASSDEEVLESESRNAEENNSVEQCCGEFDIDDISHLGRQQSTSSAAPTSGAVPFPTPHMTSQSRRTSGQVYCSASHSPLNTASLQHMQHNHQQQKQPTPPPPLSLEDSYHVNDSNDVDCVDCGESGCGCAVVSANGVQSNTNGHDGQSRLAVGGMAFVINFDPSSADQSALNDRLQNRHRRLQSRRSVSGTNECVPVASTKSTPQTPPPPPPPTTSPQFSRQSSSRRWRNVNASLTTTTTTTVNPRSEHNNANNTGDTAMSNHHNTNTSSSSSTRLSSSNKFRDSLEDTNTKHYAASVATAANFDFIREITPSLVADRDEQSVVATSGVVASRLSRTTGEPTASEANRSSQPSPSPIMRRHKPQDASRTDKDGGRRSTRSAQLSESAVYLINRMFEDSDYHRYCDDNGGQTGDEQHFDHYDHQRDQHQQASEPQSLYPSLSHQSMCSSRSASPYSAIQPLHHTSSSNYLPCNSSSASTRMEYDESLSSLHSNSATNSAKRRGSHLQSMTTVVQSQQSTLEKQVDSAIDDDGDLIADDVSEAGTYTVEVDDDGERHKKMDMDEHEHIEDHATKASAIRQFDEDSTVAAPTDYEGDADYEAEEDNEEEEEEEEDELEVARKKIDELLHVFSNRSNQKNVESEFGSTAGNNATFTRSKRRTSHPTASTDEDEERSSAPTTSTTSDECLATYGVAAQYEEPIREKSKKRISNELMSALKKINSKLERTAKLGKTGLPTEPKTKAIAAPIRITGSQQTPAVVASSKTRSAPATPLLSENRKSFRFQRSSTAAQQSQRNTAATRKHSTTASISSIDDYDDQSSAVSVTDHHQQNGFVRARSESVHSNASSSNASSMRFNRAFALRRARLGMDTCGVEISEQAATKAKESQHKDPPPKKASVATAAFRRNDGGRFSLRAPSASTNTRVSQRNTAQPPATVTTSVKSSRVSSIATNQRKVSPPSKVVTSSTAASSNTRSSRNSYSVCSSVENVARVANNTTVNRGPPVLHYKQRSSGRGTPVPTKKAYSDNEMFQDESSCDDIPQPQLLSRFGRSSLRQTPTPNSSSTPWLQSLKANAKKISSNMPSQVKPPNSRVSSGPSAPLQKSSSFSRGGGASGDMYSMHDSYGNMSDTGVNSSGGTNDCVRSIPSFQMGKRFFSTKPHQMAQFDRDFSSVARCSSAAASNVNTPLASTTTKKISTDPSLMTHSVTESLLSRQVFNPVASGVDSSGRVDTASTTPHTPPINASGINARIFSISPLDSLVISALNQLSFKLRTRMRDLLERERTNHCVGSDTRNLIDEILPQVGASAIGMDGSSRSGAPKNCYSHEPSNISRDLSNILKNLKKVEQIFDVFCMFLEPNGADRRGSGAELASDQLSVISGSNAIVTQVNSDSDNSESGGLISIPTTTASTTTPLDNIHIRSQSIVSAKSESSSSRPVIRRESFNRFAAAAAAAAAANNTSNSSNSRNGFFIEI